ncbi:serine/threonine-protein kinase Nek9-like [Bolinopsis microptera]|uniref:serine/threonine-protein kinase Nek9-like n=1 Tax=Bolinopsis microptera TaxID=2820187 RepID=UPI00307A5DAB
MAEDDCFEGLYHYLKVLGEGSFGKAVLYRRYSDNFLVVWKEVKLKSDKEIQAAQHEVDVLSLLSHRNIVGYYNNYVDSDVMYIEMEYANGGTLSHLICAQQQSFAEEEVLWYFYQLCCACVYLHSSGIIHRDIKTVNIFLNKTGILKVGDFGISKMLTSDSEAADSIVGTPYYMSPEICRGLTYGYKSDVWSCGCVLYEMLELRKTFDATNQLRLVYSIVTKEFKPVSESWSQDLRNILTSMLQKDPANRPTMQEILDTPYMKGCTGILENRLGPQNYVRGLSQLSPGRQPVLSHLSSEVYIWGGGKTSPQTLATFKKELGAVKVCVAPKHFCVVTVEKELYVWSSGHPGEMCGQLGHGDKASYRSPKRVEHLVGNGVVDVVAGDDFTLAVVEDEYDGVRVLVAFGSNYDGCLGLGEEEDNNLVPVPIPFFSGVSVVSVSCGDAHVMATTSLGELYGWGNGEYGCLGNDCEDIVYIPQKLEIRGTKFAAVSCGKQCSFVITTGGKLMACGDNQDNKLGINKIGRKGSKVAKCGETFTFKPVYGLSSVAIRVISALNDRRI